MMCNPAVLEASPWKFCHVWDVSAATQKCIVSARKVLGELFKEAKSQTRGFDDDEVEFVLERCQLVSCQAERLLTQIP